MSENVLLLCSHFFDSLGTWFHFEQTSPHSSVVTALVSSTEAKTDDILIHKSLRVIYYSFFSRSLILLLFVSVVFRKHCTGGKVWNFSSVIVETVAITPTTKGKVREKHSRLGLMENA